MQGEWEQKVDRRWGFHTPNWEERDVTDIVGVGKPVKLRKDPWG